MKTVFKRMLSLALAVMLLATAVPFQASATLLRSGEGGEGSAPKTVSVSYTLDGAATNPKGETSIRVNENGVKLTLALATDMLDNSSAYTVKSWSNMTGETVTDAQLTTAHADMEGFSLTINLEAVENPAPTYTAKIVFSGATLNPVHMGEAEDVEYERTATYTVADAQDWLEMYTSYEDAYTATGMTVAVNDTTHEVIYTIAVTAKQTTPTPTPTPTPSTNSYPVHIGLFNSSYDGIYARNVATANLTTEQYNALANNPYDNAKTLLAGTSYVGFTRETFHSLYPNDGEIEVWLKALPDGAVTPGGSTTVPGGNAQKLKLYVFVGSGSYPIDVYEGQLYLDVLKSKTPERPAQEFIGWKSDKLGRVVNSNDQITETDTVTALFGDVKTFFLTLDENRKDKETVNYGVSIPYGANVADKIAAYMPGGSKAPEREDYVFLGWKLNGKYIDEDTIWEYQDDATAYAQWALADDKGNPMRPGHTDKPGRPGRDDFGEVYLEIYKNGDTSRLIKRVNITKYVDRNSRISLEDAKDIADNYVTAKSGRKLTFEGLFDEESWWWYCRDKETDGEKYVTVNQDGDDYVYIMVNNAQIKSNHKPDSSNPKTGDNIFMAVTVMGLSATALAAAFFFTKKRAVK